MNSAVVAVRGTGEHIGALAAGSHGQVTGQFFVGAVIATLDPAAQGFARVQNILDAQRLDRHHPAQPATAVGGGHRAAYHVDLLDQVRVDQQRRIHAAIIVTPCAIDREDDPWPLQATDRRALRRSPGTTAVIHVGQGSQHRGQRIGLGILQLLAIDGGYRRR